MRARPRSRVQTYRTCLRLVRKRVIVESRHVVVRSAELRLAGAPRVDTRTAMVALQGWTVTSTGVLNRTSGQHREVGVSRCSTMSIWRLTVVKTWWPRDSLEALLLPAVRFVRLTLE